MDTSPTPTEVAFDKEILNDSSFKFGVVALIISVGVSIGVWIVAPDTTIPIKYAFIIFCSLTIYSSISTLLAITYRKNLIKTQSKINTLQNELLPPVIKSKIHNAKLLLLSKYSKLFAVGMHVSIYYDDEFEILIAQGSVINIQSNGLIQILVSEPAEKNDTFVKMKNNDKDIIGKLIIRPFGTQIFGG